jgi:hypothetical protein
MCLTISPSLSPAISSFLARKSVSYLVTQLVLQPVTPVDDHNQSVVVMFSMVRRKRPRATHFQFFISGHRMPLLTSSHVGAKYQPPPLCSLSHDLTTIIMTMGLFGWNENKKHSNTINNSTIEESDQMI